MTFYSPARDHRRFGDPYCLHLMGGKPNSKLSIGIPCSLMARFKYELLLGLEDEGTTVLRNVCGLLRTKK
jgi:hypothetical protein